jgi:hypothetical protein
MKRLIFVACALRQFSPDVATPINANQWSDSAINHLRQVRFGGKEEKSTKKENCTEKCAI